MTRGYRADQPAALQLLRVCLLVPFFFCLFSVDNAHGQDSSAQQIIAPLTNCSQVLSLSAAEASQTVPVVVMGVVTAAEPTWEGKFFVQDATGGVFVDHRTG